MSYHKAYGIIETKAPLHVGASAGEESGNLNLIFRDQFTKTGIIPGSSIRGRFRAAMRESFQDAANSWYGHEAIDGQKDGGTTEAKVKFEYASLVWLPVFCPGQPIVWVSCPLLLARYKQIAKIAAAIPKPYSASSGLKARLVPNKKLPKVEPSSPAPHKLNPPKKQGNSGQSKPQELAPESQNIPQKKVLFFNLGFLEIDHEVNLKPWIPKGVDLDEDRLVVVDDNDIAQIHDMALYRQSRVKLLEEMKKVDTEKGAFFNVEALPEGSILIFPVALKEKGWKPFQRTEAEPEEEREGDSKSATEKSSFLTDELYFGGLESIGFGRCQVTLAGEGVE